MALFFRLATLGNLALLLVTWVLGYLRPPMLGPPDSFHMPLGLLNCVVTLLVQAAFFSFVLTSTWDLEHVGARQGKDPAVAARAHAAKARAVPLVMLPALAAVLAGILGMAARALVVVPDIHGGVAALLTLGAALAAWLEPGVAAELEGLLGELGLDDEARRELGNR